MITPCGYRVIVLPDEVETVTEAGIILSINVDAERASAQYGTIMSVGPSAWKAYDDGVPWAGVGDRVCYSKFAGRFIDDPDQPNKKFLVLNDEDIIAVITKVSESI